MHLSVLNITGFQLKLVAIATMTCNHIAHVFGVYMPEWLQFALYSVGGMTFPIMAFLLVEGFRYTSNLKRYALRLAVFAIIAQVPYSLLWGAFGNVLFTLLAGLGVLWACNKTKDYQLAHIVILLASVVITAYMDWGSIGPIIIYMFFIFGKKNGGLPKPSNIALTLAIPIVCIMVVSISPLSVNDLGFALIGIPFAGVMLCFYRGMQGRSMKWLFYAYYPLHIFAIWIISVTLL